MADDVALSDVKVSAASPEDLSDMLALLRECALPETGVRESLAGFAVARIGAELVACGGLETHGADGLLRSLAVSRRHRGRGIGALLLREAIEGAKKKRLSALHLLTTTAPDYFSRLGFEVCSRNAAPDGIRASWEFRTGCPETAVFMRLPLNSLT